MKATTPAVGLQRLWETMEQFKRKVAQLSRWQDAQTQEETTVLFKVSNTPKGKNQSIKTELQPPRFFRLEILVTMTRFSRNPPAGSMVLAARLNISSLAMKENEMK